MGKTIYNSIYVGGELEIVTEADHPDSGVGAPVTIRYYLNKKEITKEEAQALLDEAKRRAQH